MRNTIATLLATWFGVGTIKWAPGTMGSLAALPFAYAIHLQFGHHILMVASLVLFLVGVWASNVYIALHKTQDPQEIVIDEVMGQWLIMAALVPTWKAYLAGFLIFRLFDILKPWPISYFDRTIPGGFGVMFDDAVAAIYPSILFGLFAIGCLVSGNGAIIATIFDFLL